MIGLVEAILLTGTTLAFATWCVVLRFAPKREAMSDRPRGSGSARAWLYAPLWLPLLLVAASLGSGILGTTFAFGDHCLVHGGHSHHLCVFHPPHYSERAIGWLVPAILAAPASLVLGLCALGGWREWRLVNTLVGISRPGDLGADVRVLEQDAPLALTVGWRNPTILLSTGLLARTSPDTLQVVLAHERAHVRRRDTWYAFFDRLAASLYPPTVSASLLQRITLSREQACDQAASVRAGGSLVVAKALAEVARLDMRAPAAGVSLASGQLEARVAHLLRPSPIARTSRLVPFAVIAATVLAGAGPVHTAMERLVTFVLH